MAENISLNSIIFSFVLGFLPVFFWLWFWTRKDCHPEPKTTILKTFLFGAFAVPLALSGEWLIYKTAFGGSGVSPLTGSAIALNSFFALTIFAGVEEIMKYQAAKRGGLRSPSFDEPIDAVIYMISAALGFAALENTIFIVKNIDAGNGVFLIGAMRFLGATLLHTLTSAIVGIFIAYSFYRQRFYFYYLIPAIIFASLLHALFNFYILKAGGIVLFIFSIVWLFALFLVLYLKRIQDN